MSTQDTTLPPLPDLPTGAVMNGRTHIDRLEATGLECEAGTLSNCADWHELKRCFEFLAEWVDRAAIAAQAQQPASPEDVAVYQSIADNYKASISQPEPKTAALWATFDEATADPLFHQARAIMGTANLGQDQALRQAILHVLGAVAQPQKAPADWLHLKPYGYAPGKYMSRCSDCGQTPTMDKRATRCRPCAEAAFGKTQQAQQAQGVPEIDGAKLVADCYRITKQARGTKGCLQFRLGAEWFREQMLAAAPQAEPAASAQTDHIADASKLVEPHVWLYDFMDGATTVRNWSTTNKAEAFAPGNFNQRGYVPAEN